MWAPPLGRVQVRSGPALGADGTLYVGSMDNHLLHAVAEENGALKWKYGTGGWVAETGVRGIWVQAPLSGRH